MPVPNDLTVEKINSIAAMENPLLRNVLITQCYRELSNCFAGYMGTGANWCTFATWASKQAGQTIRKEDLQRTLENHLKDEPEIQAALLMLSTLAKQSGAKQTLEQLRASAIGVVIAHVAANAADSVSRGNKKVFEEIAPSFSRFIDSCITDAIYNPSHIDLFSRQLKAGPPPAGQEYLAKGFTSYYQAIFEKDPREKIQLNLLANLYIGFHEQNRLQPEIVAALNAPIDTQQLKNDLLSKLFPVSNWWTSISRFNQEVFGHSLLDKSIESFVQLAQQRIRLVLTKHLMTLTLPPDNCLQLGRDLSLPFPAALAQLKNAGLLGLLATIDPTPNSLLASGASDWANLQERMHYIADLFRCYHLSPELFNEAFTPDQVTAMKNGQLPAGRL